MPEISSLAEKSTFFERTFTDALTLSNTCDLDLSNLRKAHKQVILAPIIEMAQYLEEISNEQEREEIIKGIKAQTTSNILPSNLKSRFFVQKNKSK